MTCPFCEPEAFDEWTNRHIHKIPFGVKKIILTLEKQEIEHLEKQVKDSYWFKNVQHYLRVLIDKDRTLQHRISRSREPDI